MTRVPKVRDYMRRAENHVAPRDTLERCRDLFHELSVDQLPVLELGRLVGVVEGRDVAVLEDTNAEALAQLTASSVMQGVPYTVGPDDSLPKVARHLASRRLESAVVTDAHGRVIGILPAAVVLNALARRPSSPPPNTPKEGTNQ